MLQKFDETVWPLGLDLVAVTGVSGQSADDIASASEMTRDERNGMIQGMVAGPAAKLEDNLENLDGWIMLVRSYATLAKAAKARAAYKTASARFEGNSSALVRLKSEVGGMLGQP